MRPLCQQQTNTFVTLIDEAKAYQLLREHRWADGVRCPYCQQANPAGPWPTPHLPACYRYQCRACRRFFSDRTATLFEGTKLPLSAWLLAAYLVELGHATAEIARELPCDYHTAHHVVWTIREREIRLEGGRKLSGVIEADEKYQTAGHKGRAPSEQPRHLNRPPRRRGKKPGRGRGAAVKDQPALLALVSRDGAMILEVLPDMRQESVRPVFERDVEAGSWVYTDTAKSYTFLNAAGYQHATVNHSAGEYVRGEVHENRSETVWSLWEPYIRAFRGVAQRNLDAYARVFQFRRNHRDVGALGRVKLVLTQILREGRQTAEFLLRLCHAVLSRLAGRPVLSTTPI